MDKEQEIKGQRFFRNLKFDRATINEAERSVDVSFSSETDTVMRWGEPEILDHTGANLTRLNSMGVVLFNHDPDQPIGRIVNARIENGRGLATLIFDDDEDSDKIFRKVVSGTLKGISVGYTYDEYTYLGANETSSDGRFQGPCLLVKRWTALEISVVSIPADATVGIGRSQGDALRPIIESIVKETIERMNKPKEKPPDDDGERSIEPHYRKLKMYEKLAI